MSNSGSQLFIVDNSDHEWQVRSYLAEWCDLSRAIDIATGYFEIGALLSLDEKWQAVDHIRILMGDEVSLRTDAAFKRITDRLALSVDREKLKNDFLVGVPAIVEAIRNGKIQCRVYVDKKFHAKAYITHARASVVGSFALVGSSNFTKPGLSDNIELNVQIGGSQVALLQEWYERHWDEAEDITPDILRTLERHTRDYTPFQVWFKALDEYFRGRELEPDAWEREQSVIFPQLDRYQQDGYHKLIQIAQQYGCAFLCDGVGLGKTYVGLMLLERFVFREQKQVVLFAPKAALEDVWKPVLKKYLPKAFSGFVNLVTYSHTDLQRKDDFVDNMGFTIQDADVILIDEAHHFRNPGIKGEGVNAPSRYRKLQDFIRRGDRPTQMFFLTATPVNNSVHDFRHIIELYTGGNPSYFATTLGIHSLRRHFIDLEKEILASLDHNMRLDVLTERDIVQTERVLKTDTAFDALVVQRSRAYVKQSQQLNGGNGAIFPQRELPQVAAYSVKKTYGKLLESLSDAFAHKDPLFTLGIYYPLAYWRGGATNATHESFDEGRQKQVVMLIRTLFLKRFESSAKAFEGSCWQLLRKLLAWITVHAATPQHSARLVNWQVNNAALIGYVRDHQMEFWPDEADEDQVEDFLNEDILSQIERLDPALFDIDAIIADTFADMDQLAVFLNQLAKIEPKHDDKLQALIRLLKNDPMLKREKVLIFTEFADTARYLERELKAVGITGVHRIDGGSSHTVRSDVIRRFAPYYNGSSPTQLTTNGKTEIRVLISTDVLSEGLNLQDATRLINYDLHWNPVRLMQRIGRVDRRMNPEVEARIIADNPKLKPLRGRVAYWNFLPPDELDELLRLFQRVTKKVLVISRTLGIEGKTLLTPDDQFDAIKEMNEQFDGTLSEAEQLRLEYLKLLQDHPDVAATLHALPIKLYSGRAAAQDAGSALFFCYRIPRPDATLIDVAPDTPRWSDAAGYTVWLCYDLASQQILTALGAIANLIRAQPDTPRQCKLDRRELARIRAKIETHLKNDHLKKLQAPIGVAPILKCWMELN